MLLNVVKIRKATCVILLRTVLTSFIMFPFPTISFLGMGRIGLVHLEAITKAPGVTAVMVSNPTVSKAEAAAKQYNVPRFTNDAMEVITDPDGTSCDVGDSFSWIH